MFFHWPNTGMVLYVIAIELVFLTGIALAVLADFCAAYLCRSRLNNCFVKLLTLRRDDAYNGRIDFGRPFFAWIQALRELEADVHVQTLELNTSYDIANMDSVYKLLSDVLHVQEYILWKDYEPVTVR